MSVMLDLGCSVELNVATLLGNTNMFDLNFLSVFSSLREVLGVIFDMKPLVLSSLLNCRFSINEINMI